MGLCLSHCGEAQHKAAVVAVSISHHSASPARPSRSLADVQHDPSAHASLKRFLHLYSDGAGSESRKPRSPSPRASLDDSLTIPHSSELFSLPSDSDRSRSPSPARGSTAARSSTSSRPRSSSPALGGHRPGRFSTDKPPIPPRGSNASRKSTPARKSCSSLPGQVVEPPHKSLVETIARLEKLCDLKLFLESRSASSNSPHEMNTTTVGHESNSILLHESCRDLAQKLLCFANEHADGILSRSDSVRVMKLASVTSDACGVQVKETGVPLENSVASFLSEVESLVSKVDAAREGSPSVNRLPSLRFQDADEKIQFTDFEATFELRFPESTGSDRRSVEGDQVPSRASTSAENSAPRLASCQPGHRRSRTSSDLGGVYHVKSSNLKGSQQKGPKNPVFRAALTDISSNVTPAYEPVARKSQPLKAQTVKRGGSRSLDLQNCSLSQLEFDTLKSERWQSTQGAAETVCREESQSIASEEAQRIEAKESQSIEAQESPRIEAEESRSIEAEESQRAGYEESERIEAADSATTQQLAGEGQGNAPSPSADAAPSQSQPTEGRVSVDGEERIQESVCTEDANGGEEVPNIPLHSDIQDKSLAMTFDSLFKLLQSPPGELAQNTSQLLEILGATANTPSNAELSPDGTHLLDAVETASETPQAVVETAPETPQAGMPLSACDAESWHDAPVSLTITEQQELPALHSTTTELKCLPEVLPGGLPGGLPEAVLTNSFCDTAK